MAAISHQSVPFVAGDWASDANRNQAAVSVRPPQSTTAAARLRIEPLSSRTSEPSTKGS